MGEHCRRGRESEPLPLKNIAIGLCYKIDPEYIDRMIFRITLLIALLSLGSCKQVQQVSDAFVKPSPREVYARNFGTDHLTYSQWRKSFESTLKDSLHIDLPYVEAGSFLSQDFPVYGYTTDLNRGEKVIISFITKADSVPVFIDIYKFGTADSLAVQPLMSEHRFGRLPVALTIEETGKYRIFIQSELRQSADFQIEIYTLPTLPFPVAGVSDKAVQSFWGARRSAGGRLHEGIDIFAPRLTPVLAVAEGRVSFTGERGLGGKQVWLREGVFKKSFYYAHLDSINVKTTNKVSIGDTLGFVGYTGNARTTLPHLHFGIYTGNGAIDPLPFIRRKDRNKTALTAPAFRGFVASQRANVRLGPNNKAQILTTLKYRDTVSLVGRTVDWYHAQLPDKMEGFIHHTLVQEIDLGGSSGISAN